MALPDCSTQSHRLAGDCRLRRPGVGLGRLTCAQASSMDVQFSAVFTQSTGRMNVWSHDSIGQA